MCVDLEFHHLPSAQQLILPFFIYSLTKGQESLALLFHSFHLYINQIPCSLQFLCVIPLQILQPHRAVLLLMSSVPNQRVPSSGCSARTALCKVRALHGVSPGHMTSGGFDFAIIQSFWKNSDAERGPLQLYFLPFYLQLRTWHERKNSQSLNARISRRQDFHHHAPEDKNSLQYLQTASWITLKQEGHCRAGGSPQTTTEGRITTTTRASTHGFKSGWLPAHLQFLLYLKTTQELFPATILISIFGIPQQLEVKMT